MYYDFKKVKKIPITKIIEDWGIKSRKKNQASFYVLCPNPKHGDKELGSCVVTSNERINCFHCFSCGTKGGIVDFVAMFKRCSITDAAKILSEEYDICKTITHKKKPKQFVAADDYAVIGLRDRAYIKFPGQDLNKTEVYTIAEFAEECPEDYNALIMAKTVEKLCAIEHFFQSEDAKYCPKEVTAETFQNVVFDVFEKAIIKKEEENVPSTERRFDCVYARNS